MSVITNIQNNGAWTYNSADTSHTTTLNVEASSMGNSQKVSLKIKLMPDHKNWSYMAEITTQGEGNVAVVKKYDMHETFTEIFGNKHYGYCNRGNFEIGLKNWKNQTDHPFTKFLQNRISDLHRSEINDLILGLDRDPKLNGVLGLV